MKHNDLHVIAFKRDDIRQANITIKPRFENSDFKFYHVLIPKAPEMKGIPALKQQEGNEGLKTWQAKEAWRWILGMLSDHT